MKEKTANITPQLNWSMKLNEAQVAALERLQEEARRMKYKAHPTQYNGVMFRSRLEARWAAFFDLNDIKWQYEPIDLQGWTPDFLIQLWCPRSDCSQDQKFYVEVKPAADEYELLTLVSTAISERVHEFGNDPAILLLGLNPKVSYTTVFSCGGNSGGSWQFQDLCFAVHTGLRDLFDKRWKQAGNVVQWKLNI